MSVISPTNAILTTITVGSYPQGVAVNPTNGDVYVTDNYFGASGYLTPGSVSVISPTNAILTTITVGSFPWGVAVAP